MHSLPSVNHSVYLFILFALIHGLHTPHYSYVVMYDPFYINLNLSAIVLLYILLWAYSKV